MKVCLVHNSYGRRSGEEAAVDGLAECLVMKGHDVVHFDRTSERLRERSSAKVAAFFSGIYSYARRREFATFLSTHRPDIIHINNLYPLISPSILDEAVRFKIPAVMTLHNYRLLCPTGLLMVRDQICERCAQGAEWWCAIRNCTGERPKSVAYAVRNWVAKHRRSFNAISRFVAPTYFVKSVMMRYGYAPDRIAVVPYVLNWDWTGLKAGVGKYVGFVGRISPEKGIGVIIEAARLNPDIEFRFAGHHSQMPQVVREAPRNCVFVGPVDRARLGEFFADSRLIVFSSTWYETCGISLLEAMAHGRAVIVSRLGAPAETIENGRTGIYFAPGDAADLSDKIRYLWKLPELCRMMGQEARAKVLRDFSPDRAYDGILKVYATAIESENSSRPA
jgi:glycosyltransferase involved in cell wall biosynthesis